MRRPQPVGRADQLAAPLYVHGRTQRRPIDRERGNPCDQPDDPGRHDPNPIRRRSSHLLHKGPCVAIAWITKDQDSQHGPDLPLRSHVRWHILHRR